ncbi:MAG TPA: potassium-transporting ATPase subunit KdpA, partial [Tepidisphaeraceae bacterium]
MLAITKPIGLYLVAVLERGRTWLDPLLGPIERLIYRLLGVDTTRDHTWKQYAAAMLVFSFIGLLLTYGILRLQMHLPLQGSPEALSTA